jgi:peroxiredoxin
LIVKRYQLGILLLAGLTGGIFYAWARISAELPSRTPDLSPPLVEAVPSAEPGVSTGQHHLATERMIVNSAKANGTSAPDFEAPANDGKTYRLSEMIKNGPAVLIFIKNDCPCSRSADVFLQRLHTAGRGWVPFYGVIDGGVPVAEKWAEESNTVFPILADPEKKIIQTYGAESSAYVAFIGPDGEIEKLWAGYSETMLKELGEKMARWVKPGLETFDVSDAPAELYSGCPYSTGP